MSYGMFGSCPPQTSLQTKSKVDQQSTSSLAQCDQQDYKLRQLQCLSTPQHIYKY